MTYIIYEYSKRENSKWFHLINNLPKDNNHIIFWDDEKLQLLDDEKLEKSAKKGLKEFQNIYLKIKSIIKKYPKLFNEKDFSFENTKWIHTHLTTRCFGKFLCYVTMVPFAEYFNHECTDVYYDLECNNPENNENYVDNEFEELSTSEESNNSEDSDSLNEFNYDNDETDEDSVWLIFF